jgi:DNA-binding transcriptional LysR family regulator
MLDGVSRFENEVNRVSAVHRGSLRIGIIDNVIFSSDYRIARALRTMNTRFPGIYPEVVLLQQATLEEAVRNRTVDLGITADPLYYQSLAYEEIFAEQSRMYVAQGSTLDERLTAGEPVSHLPYVRRRHRALTFQKLEQQYNLQPGATADGLEAAALLVAAGAGIGFLAAHYVESMPALRLREVEHESTPFDIQFYAVTRMSVSQPPALVQMVKLLRREQ